MRTLRFVVLLAILATACAPYRDRMRPVLAAMAQRDYERALSALDRDPDPQSVLWQMERGLLLRYAGRLRESNEAFAAALDRQEDLFTRSVSNEAASLLLNDAVRPYRASDYEIPLLRFYSTLNYLELGQVEGALVEARALSLQLEMRATAEDRVTPDWGLGRTLAGLVFEAGGEWNDAWIAYRAAAAAYAAGDTSAYAGVRSWLIEAIDRTAIEAGLEPGQLGPPPARVVVWVEDGFIPQRDEVHLRVPILREEKDWDANKVGVWSDRLGRRAIEAYHGHPSWQPVEIAYLLDVALPVYPETPPRIPRLSEVRVNGEVRNTTVRAEDLERSARSALADAYPGIAARSAARAVLKWLATRGAASRGGETAERIVNLLGVVTERADTRSWIGLPESIGFSVVDVAPGPVVVEVQTGVSGETCTGEFALAAGGWHFLSCRFY